SDASPQKLFASRGRRPDDPSRHAARSPHLPEGELIMSSALRDLLAKHVGRRIRLRGTIQKIRFGPKDPSACLIDPEFGEAVVDDHLWIWGITNEWQDKRGCQVEFSAVVRSYPRGRETTYSVRNPMHLRVLSLPCLPIPEPIDPRQLACVPTAGAGHAA